MKEGKVFKVLLIFGILIIIGMFINCLYNVIDVYFISIFGIN